MAAVPLHGAISVLHFGFDDAAGVAGWSRAQRPTGLELVIRGCSSAGRAPDLHSGGRRFDSDQLHQLPTGSGPVAQLARAHP